MRPTRAYVRLHRKVSRSHGPNVEMSPWERVLIGGLIVLGPLGSTPTKGTLEAKLAMAAVMVMEHQDDEGDPSGPIRFDTDSRRIGVDNRCTACISDKRHHFTGPLTPIKRTIKGFGGATTMDIWIGTIQWNWLDEHGRKHQFAIPNSFYIPSGKVCLLSPQHWAQTATDGAARIKALIENDGWA